MNLREYFNESAVLFGICLYHYLCRQIESELASRAAEVT